MNTIEIWESAERGCRWLTSRLEPDGRFRGSTAVVDHYKAPFALLMTGCVRESERILDYVSAQLLEKGGDLKGVSERFAQFRIYPHCWLAVAALMRGRFALARMLLGVIQRYRDPRTGGFFATAAGCDAAEGQQEIMTTSMAGLACLWAGDFEAARGAGAWLQRIHAAQPDPALGLYTTWHSRNGLVIDYPPEEAKFFLVDTAGTRQFYFHYGIAAAFLACLAEATGQSSWLQLARRFLGELRHFPPDVLGEIRSGKVGWGAAWTYRASREPSDRVIALKAAEGLQALQNPDGSWPHPDESAYGDDRPDGSVDITAELAGHLACIALAC